MRKGAGHRGGSRRRDKFSCSLSTMLVSEPGLGGLSCTVVLVHALKSCCKVCLRPSTQHNCTVLAALHELCMCMVISVYVTKLTLRSRLRSAGSSSKHRMGRIH